ncbi:hypothetical protein MPNT_20092 [Candidatus Methylacidithermus pantelleriae]|uniref:Uncharacterized protein n=1 Tax=Candidatus Methylacidithermus pantelleriae TaxID=2744239 RepID=A0A8J2BME5_9BACT|nr:hypothetical protein MPNT_20092 [Candidatus Methylacidithermus pantelleriae]
MRLQNPSQKDSDLVLETDTPLEYTFLQGNLLGKSSGVLNPLVSRGSTLKDKGLVPTITWNVSGNQAGRLDVAWA